MCCDLRTLNPPKASCWHAERSGVGRHTYQSVWAKYSELRSKTESPALASCSKSGPSMGDLLNRYPHETWSPGVPGSGQRVADSEQRSWTDGRWNAVWCNAVQEADSIRGGGVGGSSNSSSGSNVGS